MVHLPPMPAAGSLDTQLIVQEGLLPLAHDTLGLNTHADRSDGGSSDKLEESHLEKSSSQDAESGRMGQTRPDQPPEDLTTVLNGYEPANDEEKELDRRINLKLDSIVLPLLSITYFLSGWDSNNIGNALTAGFIKDTGFNIDTVNNAVSMTAVTIALAPFLIPLGRRIGVNYYLPFLAIGWSACGIGTAFCKSEGTFYFVRMLQAVLGVPNVQLSLYVVSMLYPRKYYGRRLAVYIGSSIFAGAFGGAIAYAVFKLPETGLKNWQKLFILEGSISMFFGFMLLIFLPGKLGSYWLFTKAEKAHAVARATREGTAFSTNGVDANNVGWRDYLNACKDWQKLLLILAMVCTVMPVTSFLVFSAVIVAGMGYDGIQANLMTVTPFLAAGVGIYAFQWSSDRFKERGLHLIACGLLSIIGLAVMIGSDNKILRYVFLHICLGGAFAPGTIIAAWLADNSPDPSTRSVVFGLLALSAVSSVIAGQVFKPKYAPTFKTPLKIAMGMVVASIILYGTVRVLYMIENKKRKQMLERMTPEEIEAERVNPARRGDRKITFIRHL